jgi:OmpA-OmpF porin, OOP family
MNGLKKLIWVFVFFACTAAPGPAAAQLGNIGKRMEDKLKRRADQKIDRTIDKGLDAVEQGIDDAVSGSGEGSGQNTGGAPAPAPTPTPAPAPPANPAPQPQTGAAPPPPEPPGSARTVNTKYDFVPGDRMVFFDDFTADQIGDFPAKWNTNGSGEVITFDQDQKKWFGVAPGSIFIPDLPSPLPKEFTFEFDLIATGITEKTSSGAKLRVVLDESTTFQAGKNQARFDLPFVKYIPSGVYINNRVNSSQVISNTLDGDLRGLFDERTRVSVAVNKQRLRVYLNENKVVDVPRLVPDAALNAIKFEPVGLKPELERLFIGEFKMAEGGLDLRAKLLAEGRLSTNGIQFDVNSASLKPESYGIIREIALALQGSTDMKLRIVGHTDSDGDAGLNLDLSRKRAEAVKKALIEHYGISAQRLEVDGKGESEPVADNGNPQGKAENRRVEFVVI